MRLIVICSEPLASVVDYLGDELYGRAFVPTEELVEALEVEPTAFGRQMGDLGCRSTRDCVSTDDGSVRQVRGYLTATIARRDRIRRRRDVRGVARHSRDGLPVTPSHPV